VRRGALACLCLLAALASVPGRAGALGPIGGLDGRSWELVSPANKNGGQVGVPGTPEAGVAQAAVGGGAVAYGSDASFAEPAGSPPVSQYVATRGAAGWSSANLSPPLLAGTYEGDPYLFFSENLSKGLLSNGWSCADGSNSCEAENPPLGTGAPSGYRNLYLREGSTYTPLITTTNSSLLTVSAQDFRLSFGAASADLSAVVFSTCAALVAGALEVPGTEGCDPAAQNLYRWHFGTLEVVNKLPAQPLSAPGAAIANAAGAVSQGGSRVYWSREGNLYLREGGETEAICEACSFQRATADGSFAFYLKAAHLHRYSAATQADADLTPGGGVAALLAASADGETLFYAASDGLYRRAGATSKKLFSATPASLPPQSGRAVASADGERLFFTYPGILFPRDTDNAPDVYEWEAQGRGSCTSAGGCFGMISANNGLGGQLLDASASGDDVYFTTASTLLLSDPGATDVYDARVGGGLPEPGTPFECEGDDCQGPAPAPEDPTPGTASVGARSNPPLRILGKHKKHHHPRKHKHQKHHKGKRAGRSQ
jgi:hypothetical protein